MPSQKSKPDARPDTRIEILKAGAALIHKNGFQSTGIQEIVQASGVPKGSFYHYFKSKEDFGLQVLDFYSGFMLSWVHEALGDTSLPPIARLRGFFEDFRAYAGRKGFEGGCPIGNFSLEAGRLGPAFKEKIDSVFGEMRAAVQACLSEASLNMAASNMADKGRGRGAPLVLPASLDVSDAADFIINSWEGALLRAKVTGHEGPLIVFEKAIFEGLLK